VATAAPMEAAAPMTVRAGRATSEASSRGATSSTRGSAPDISSASICSLTAIEPSSALWAAACREAAKSPVRSGANSRMMSSRYAGPTTVMFPVYLRA